jgi:hypothetical protein
MDTKDLIRVLKTVPEFRLRLIELAWKVIREDGQVDQDKVSFNRKEIDEAVEEAKAYGQATKEAVRCLMQMVQHWY